MPLLIEPPGESSVVPPGQLAPTASSMESAGVVSAVASTRPGGAVAQVA